MSKDATVSAQASRLKAARKSMFPKAAKDAYHLVRKYISLQGYQHHESGQRSFRNMANIYASVFGVTESWLLWGHETMAAEEIPIVGKAEMGPDGYHYDPYPDGGHPTLDPYPEGSIAVEVHGLSNYPRFNEGEKLVFGPVVDPTACIGREVLVELEDGRHLIKILRRNRHDGSWELYSHNPSFPVIEDARIVWVRAYQGMRT